MRAVQRIAAAMLAAGGAASALLPMQATGAGGLPHIRHVWIVMLENEGYNSTFVTNRDTFPYLAKTLPSQGALIENYYGIAHQSLANYIALISGQAPTADTQGDCPNYVDVEPGTPGPDPHQVNGQGCVYPAGYITVADQLEGLGYSWKGYMEDLMQDSSRDGPVTCTAPPQSGTVDQTQRAEAQDQYAARHDPFMYFHSIIDDQQRCRAHVVPLLSQGAGLYHDLESLGTTPNFSFVVPNLCDDGHDPSTGQTSCAGPDAKGDTTGGYRGIEDWLTSWIPIIMASAAYQQDGMIVIAFDEAPPQSDSSSCCNEHPGPNTQDPGAPAPSGGGGKVGAVVLSPFVKPGTVVPVNARGGYNHYSLLKTVENIFRVPGGDDGAGHLGYASNDKGSSAQDPGAMGADVFTNPGYVPPPPPPAGIFTLPPPPAVYALPPSAPGHTAPGTPSPAASAAVGASPGASPSATPAHWDRSMLAGLPQPGGGLGVVAAFVLAPLMVTGAITLFLRRGGG